MAGPSLILPYLLPMLLGRAIDLHNYEIETNVYDDVKYKETKLDVLNATYHVVNGGSFPYEYFGMPIDIVLRIKAGYLSSKSGALGLDGLLKDLSKMHSSAVVAAMVVYSKVRRDLPPDAKLLDGWKDRIPKNSTHYASQMTYGGWVAVLYQFKCKISSDVPHVYQTVVDVLGKSGQLQDNTHELWFKVKKAVEQNEKVRGEVEIVTRLYSSVKLPVVHETPSQLTMALKQLPKYIEGPGIPIFMNLKPMAEIDSTFPLVKRNDELSGDLRKLDYMWEDVMHAKSKVMQWLQNTDTIFEEEEEDRVFLLLEKINQCIRLFRFMIADISVYSKVDKSSLQKAFDTYNKGLDTAIDSYHFMYLRLKEELDVTCERSFLKGIKGLLKVFDNEQRFMGEVKGIDECKTTCMDDSRCRSIGFGETVSQMDQKTGQYISKKNQCWLYYRSTSTAPVVMKNDLYGDLHVHDLYCL